MNTVMLLIARYEKPRLNVREIADLMGISVSRVQNMRSEGSLPIPTYKEGSQVYADIRDVAEYLDGMRAKARALAGLSATNLL